MIERLYSLRQAAAAIGISRQTLKKRLAKELAIFVDDLKRGEKALLRERDLKLLISRIALKSDPTRWRGLRKVS